MDNYRIIRPHPLLSPYISYYWGLQSSGEGGGIQRVIPTGCIQLIIHFTTNLYSETRSEWQPKAFLGGQTSSYEDLTLPENIDMLAIVFHPYGAKAFFPFPMTAVYNSTINLADLELPWIKEMEEEVYLALTMEERIRIIETYFIHQITENRLFNIRRLTPSIHLVKNTTEVNVSRMAGISCLSQKQYNRIFQEFVGMNPKEFIRVSRFQRALYFLQNQPDYQLQSLAFDCGYYDLSHMDKEFRIFSGHTPGEYLSSHNPYSDYFNVE